MNFGDAVQALKAGHKVAREGWNGKGMFLFLVQGSSFAVNRPPLMGIFPEGHVIKYKPHIDMFCADGEVVPWLASQSDVLCEDWVEVASVITSKVKHYGATDIVKHETQRDIMTGVPQCMVRFKDGSNVVVEGDFRTFDEMMCAALDAANLVG